METKPAISDKHFQEFDHYLDCNNVISDERTVEVVAPEGMEYVLETMYQDPDAWQSGSWIGFVKRDPEAPLPEWLSDLSWKTVRHEQRDYDHMDEFRAEINERRQQSGNGGEDFLPWDREGEMKRRLGSQAMRREWADRDSIFRRITRSFIEKSSISTDVDIPVWAMVGEPKFQVLEAKRDQARLRQYRNTAVAVVRLGLHHEEKHDYVFLNSDFVPAP